MKRITPIILATLALGGQAGCAKTIAVSVPAHPAVQLDHHRFAVVAVDRHCQAVADALTRELHALDGVTVDPTAPARLEVITCGNTLQPSVDIEQSESVDRRRVQLEGRSHAVVAVKLERQMVAHLIGSGQGTSIGAWGDTTSGAVSGMGSAMRRDLGQQLARDLASQVDPLPRLVSRRIHPKASDGSARQLHASAVFAEQRGDFDAARTLARRARDASPNPRYADYAAELDRVVAALEPPQ